MTQSQLLSMLRTWIKKNYPKDKIIITNDYIVAEGDIPIALSAHLDTVGDAPPEDIYYDPKKKVMWSPQLMGADDRAGVYAIIQIIQAGYRPCIIFSTDEEQGCLGASTLVQENPICPLENLKAIFQLDRRGREDSVYYNCNNPDFEEYVNKFGFTTAYGTFTDISVIAPAWGVAAVNLSIGYEDEHTKLEILHTDWMWETIEKVKNILDAEKDMKMYSYIPAATPDPFNWSINPKACFICNGPLGVKYHHMEEPGWEYNVCHTCFTKCF